MQLIHFVCIEFQWELGWLWGEGLHNYRKWRIKKKMDWLLLQRLVVFLVVKFEWLSFVFGVSGYQQGRAVLLLAVGCVVHP